MTYASMVPEVRDALTVTSAYDTLILAGIRRAVSYMLRNFNLPKSVLRFAPAAFAAATTRVVMPANFGKVKIARITSGGVVKMLRRREEGVPSYGGALPEVYYMEGNDLVFDVAAPAATTLEVWYQTTDPATVEPWITTDIRDILFHRACFEIAPIVRKPEAQAIFAPLWQEDLQVLAIYTNEQEFGGMDMRMGLADRTGISERYPSR